jgi:hypothetical protein
MAPRTCDNATKLSRYLTEQTLDADPELRIRKRRPRGDRIDRSGHWLDRRSERIDRGVELVGEAGKRFRCRLPFSRAATSLASVSVIC